MTMLGHRDRASLRIGRWVERLKDYNFKVEYKAGVTNFVSDMLSRLPSDSKYGLEEPDAVVISNIWEVSDRVYSNNTVAKTSMGAFGN